MENFKKSLVILAGGLGSRYQGLKQIDGILPNGSTLLEYSIFDGLRAGFNKIVFIINESIPQSFIARMSKILESKKVEFHWIIQNIQDYVEDKSALNKRIKPWGTAHAVLCAEKVVQENFVVINADDYYGPEVYQIAARLINNRNINAQNYATILYPLVNTLSKNGTVSRGRCIINNENEVKSIEELTHISAQGNEIYYTDDKNLKHPLLPDVLVSMNLWILNPSIFGFIKADFETFISNRPKASDEIYLPSIINSMINNDEVRVAVEVSPEKWQGVTYAQDKPELQAFLLEKIANNIYPEELWI